MKLHKAKMLHVWVLGALALAYLAVFAPTALESMILVSGKVWVGALSGYGIDKALFDYARPDDDAPNPDWMLRRALVVAACVLGLAVGV